MKKKFIIPLLILGMSIGACQKPDDGPESEIQTPESGTQTPEGGSQNPEGGETTPTYTIDIPSSEDTSPVLGTEGGTVVLNFSTSAEWTANVINTRADSWIDVSPKSGNAGEAKITISVGQNDTYDERSATIQIKCGSAEKNIVVTQKQKDALTVTKSRFDIPAEGGEITIEVNSNLSYDYTIDAEGAKWIKETKTKAISTNTYYFTVDANNSFETREATITFESKNFDLKETVKITQNCEEILTVNVPNKGGLQASLSGIDISAIKSLKITGILNDVDFIFIRGMEALRNLDISEVEITTLPAWAFKSTKIESIILPNMLSEIGEGMFYESRYLKSVVIYHNVKRIDNRAFMGCTSLTSIKIPASVELIDYSAFKSCKLATVTFEEGSHLKTIGGKRTINPDGAFANCTSLTSIEIPASVELIELATFRGCTKLETVTFEKGSQLKNIGYSAFRECRSLPSITIPSSVEIINDLAFYDCSKLETVNFEKGSQLKTIGDSAFSGLKLMIVDMSECTQVESIGSKAFYNNWYLRLFMIGTINRPDCKTEAFKGISPSYSVLKVPSGCVDVYKAATGWENFSSITTLDE